MPKVKGKGSDRKPKSTGKPRTNAYNSRKISKTRRGGK
jgi:hypothetical protein